MTGGLIQLVLSGKQDGYLTFNPEITFFKKVYRRHTIFGIEFLENFPEQQPDYNNKISFKISNIGDLINKCFIEIELPEIKFTESIQVTNLKKTHLDNINKQINKWKTLYNNLKKFCSIEILLYQQLINLLDSTNINLNSIKLVVSKFNSKYKKEKDKIINLLLNDVYNSINLSAFISNLDKNIIIDESIDIDSNTQIYVSTLKNNIQQFYTNMTNTLGFYFKNFIYYSKLFSNLNNKNIYTAWNQFIAHFFFTQFEIEIGGQIVESYSADQGFIYQMHHLKSEQMENYLEMIGHKSELNKFNNNTKPSQIIILPLNFWFCKDTGSSLPCVALSNTNISINLKINDIKKLIYFVDIENEYYEFLNITLPYDTYITNNLLFNVETFDFDNISKLITFKCKNINKNLFIYKYPSLPINVVDEIFNTYADISNNMNLNEWINFKINYNQYQEILNIYKFNDFNQYYSLIPKPKIKLITESIFLDEIERNKFGSSKLEYVVEGFQENIFDIEKQLLFNSEFSIDRPVKELIWFFQPKLFTNGLTEFGKKYISSYDFSHFFNNNYFNKLQITLNQITLIKHFLDNFYFQIVQPFQKYNNSLPNGVYCYNFGLYPEEIQPSGTANFSMFKGKQILIEMNNIFLSQYFNNNINPLQLNITLKFLARSYNFFVVEKGQGKMIFTTN